MYLTIDTSALIAVIGNEQTKPLIIELSKGYDLCAPMSVHWEIGNAFSAMLKRQRIRIDSAKQALIAYNSIPIKYIDIPLDKALGIAHAHNMYAYDAYLIQCALQTNTSLLTLDNGLSNIAKTIGISLLEVAS